MHKLLPLLALASALISVDRHPVNSAGQARTWNVEAINAPQLWPLTTGRGINVVVIDTGIDYFHDELRGIVAGGFNAVDPQALPFDDNYHGTHVAGIIAAANNALGVVGAAPGVTLWAAKVFDGGGRGSEANIAAALEWTIAQKAARGGNWIVNMSFTDDSPIAASAIRRAADAGILLIAASGLTNQHIGYPAAFPEVIAVGAVDAKGQRSNLSAYGPGLALVAPGVDVLSPITTNLVYGGELEVDGLKPIRTRVVAGAAHSTVMAPLIDCGIGDSCASAAAGFIALVRRSNVPIAAAARNAINLGALAVVIANNDDSPVGRFSLIDDPFAPAVAWPPVGAITQLDAEPLHDHFGEVVTLDIRSEDYQLLTGTSQAAPHVTAAAALAWSLRPSATAAEVREALIRTAHDLGPLGYDEEYGYGMVDAYAAAQRLAPAAFAVPRRRRPW
jgi:subtilisin family serine protease